MNHLGGRTLFDEEDDDLESLRLAALQTLHKKIEVPAAQANIGSSCQVMENIPPHHFQSAIYPSHPSNLVESCCEPTNHALERLDIKELRNEPYVPHAMIWNTEQDPKFVPYVPTRIGTIPGIKSDVQLSPRSAAFVSSNNQILMRRKGEKSPSLPSNSPTYRPKSWSPPSPVYRKRRSPGFDNLERRSPVYRVTPPLTRRSITKSPPLKRYVSRSPPPAKRYSSRSPPNRRLNGRSNSRSPGKFPYRSVRSRSRSPSGRVRRPSPVHRPPLNKNIKRSPSPRHISDSRRMSPINRGSNGNWNIQTKSPSPSRHRIQNYYKKSSRSPVRVPRKRSRSPPLNRGIGTHSPFRKSPHSKSPIRKIRKSRERVPLPVMNKNRSPDRGGNKYNNSRKGFDRNGRRDRRLQIRNERNRSSPLTQLKRRKTRSKSPITRVGDVMKNNEKIVSSTTTQKQNEIVYEKVTEIIKEKSIKIQETNVKERTEQELEEELMQSTDDENNEICNKIQKESSDDDNDDDDDIINDEIDLFASEESESENEGRFKSSSTKTERSTIPTVSFSKLGASSLSNIGELKDVNATSSSLRNSDRRKERTSSNKDYGRNRRADRDNSSFRKRDNSRNRRDKDRSNKFDENEIKKKSGDIQKSENMKMFKSTFQAVVVSDPPNKNAVTTKAEELPSEVKERIEKRGLMHLNRPISFKDPKEKSEDLAITAINSSTTTTTKTSTSTGAATVPSVSSSVGKKPIHLRLGGYSNSSGGQTKSAVVNVTGKSSLSSGTGSGTSSLAMTWKGKKSWKTLEKV